MANEENRAYTEEEMQQDKSFTEKLTALENPEDLPKLLEEYGAGLEYADLLGEIFGHYRGGELTEDELENIAGGATMSPMMTFEEFAKNAYISRPICDSHGFTIGFKGSIPLSALPESEARRHYDIYCNMYKNVRLLNR